MERELKQNEFQCAMCKGIFEKGWSDEEAEKEAEELWGKKTSISDPRMVIVCDNCFQKIHPAKFPEKAERARSLLTNNT